MNKVARKFATLAMASLMLVTPVVAYAQEGVEVKNGENTVEYSISGAAVNDEHEHSVPVKLSIPSTYKVALPVAIVLDRENEDSDKFTGEYTVAVHGNIRSDNYVLVEPVQTFEMVGITTDTKSEASVTQPIKIWRRTVTDAETQIQADKNSYVQTGGQVTATLTQADKYSGGLQFTFSLQKDS